MRYPDYDELERLQEALSYNFKNISLLKQALTRTSAINESYLPIEDNQKLEFLGDKVLGLVIGDILMNQDSDSTVGDLSQNTSRLVRNDKGPLLGVAKKLELGNFLIVGRGEEQTNIRQNKKALVDTLEAIIGAIFIDSGKDYEVMIDFILEHWNELALTLLGYVQRLDNLISNNKITDDQKIKHFEKIKKLIMDDEDIKDKDDVDKTIFHYKCITNNKELMTLILENYKDLSDMDLSPKPELYPKVNINGINFSFCKLLRDINFSNTNLKFANFSRSNLQFVNFSNADLQYVNFSYVHFKGCNFKNADLMGTDCYKVTVDHSTKSSINECLYAAVSSNQINNARGLILLGANVNTRVYQSFTVLHTAVKIGNLEIVKLLLNKEADVNSTCITNVMLGGRTIDTVVTPLHLAALNGDIKIVRILLENGAEKNNESWDITPRDMARQNKYFQTANLLKDEVRERAVSQSYDSYNELSIYGQYTNNLIIESESAKTPEQSGGCSIS